TIQEITSSASLVVLILFRIPSVRLLMFLSPLPSHRIRDRPPQRSPQYRQTCHCPTHYCSSVRRRGAQTSVLVRPSVAFPCLSVLRRFVQLPLVIVRPSAHRLWAVPVKRDANLSRLTHAARCDEVPVTPVISERIRFRAHVSQSSLSAMSCNSCCSLSLSDQYHELRRTIARAASYALSGSSSPNSSLS